MTSRHTDPALHKCSAGWCCEVRPASQNAWMAEMQVRYAYLVYVAVVHKGDKAKQTGAGTHISSTFGWYMRLTKPIEGDLYG